MFGIVRIHQNKKCMMTDMARPKNPSKNQLFDCFELGQHAYECEIDIDEAISDMYIKFLRSFNEEPHINVGRALRAGWLSMKLTENEGDYDGQEYYHD